MPRSARIVEPQDKAAEKARIILKERERRKPHPCEQCGARSRVGCKLCEKCAEDTKDRKHDLPLLWQGCTQISWGQTDIRWSRDFSDLALWIEQYLKLVITRGSANTPSRAVCVVGWKGRETPFAFFDGRVNPRE
jgi:hypothetical protein